MGRLPCRRKQDERGNTGYHSLISGYCRVIKMEPAAIIKPPLFGTAADACRMFFDYGNDQLVNGHFPVDVVFIGDSITHMWEVQSCFGHLGHIVNRGISGDVAEIMIKRLEADAVQLKPRICVSLIGINNIYAEGAQFNAVRELLLTSARQLLEQLQQAAILPVICSVLPVFGEDAAVTQMRNNWILQINQELSALCCRKAAVYADYHVKMTDSDGCTLRRTLSWDGVHPHSAGYACMASVLEPVLANLLKNDGKDKSNVVSTACEKSF